MEDHTTSFVAGKAVDSLLVVAKTQIGYIWNSTENIENLKNEAENLKLMRGNVQKHITSAKRKGDDLLDGVQDWADKAGVKISDAQEIIKQEAKAKKAKFGNWPGTRYQYGKQATNMTSSLLQHQKTGKNFVTCVSVETRAPGPLDVYENKNLGGLVSHNSTLKDIIGALEDESKQIIGIYGLGGVGKTTLAKEVVAKVKHLFADVAFTTVSQTVKVEEIKKDIRNATKRIVKGEKVLIILDDVWEKLDLEELCIPINHTNCKILLTSRSERVCQKMKAQSKICVNSLPAKEAWIVFKHVVGERVETDADLKPVAEEVAKGCGGLPLLIQAVGNALKDESIDSWKAALSRLKKPAASEMDPDIEKAFTRLKLSYDYLKSEEAKSCFMLCSLFPEDHDISLEDLVFYGVGLEKFDDLDSIEDASGRVQNAVNILTSSGLLLNSKWKGCTKMHDVVRDVALLIASEGKNRYLVKAGKNLTEWQPRNKSLESYTGVSLMNNGIPRLPDYEVHLSSLDIFLVNNNPQLRMISDEFIRCIKKVKVLDISWNNISSLPQSFQLLTKLRMLNLEENCFFHEISILGEMKELEILILNKTGIIEIPQEIGQLVNLRRLELIGCRYMTRVTPGVISKLQSLEELCIDLSRMSEGVNGCTAEVMKLSKLTYLDLTVNSFDHIPEGFNSENLKGFVIHIGYFYRGNEFRRSDRYLLISSKHLVIPLLKWLKKLIEVSRPHIYLSRIENLNNIMPTLYDEGFNKLEHIKLKRCSNVSCLVELKQRKSIDEHSASCNQYQGKTEENFFKELKHLYLEKLNKLEVLWKCPDEYISLTNLVTLSIYNCHKLVRVFTVSVAQGLVNLKELRIIICYGLEEVIWGADGGEEIKRGESEEIVEQQQHSSSSTANTIIIVFPSLALIYLYDLPSLKRFFNSKAGNRNCSIIKYPSLVYVEIDNYRSMKTWGPGIHETPNLKTLEMFSGEPILLDGPCAINDAVEKQWRKWKDNHPSI